MTRNKHGNKNERQPGKVLGVTGGVGAGKSTVLQYLKDAYGAVLIKCDDVGRELQKPQGACFEPLVRLLAPYGCVRDGALDRLRMAEVLFSDPELLEQVNKVVHPAVYEEVLRMIKEQFRNEPLIVIESALLLQAGYDEICDTVWYIYAGEEIRRERLKSSRGYTDEKVDSIFQSQNDDAWFREKADFVIDNSSPDVQNTYEQIDRIMNY